MAVDYYKLYSDPRFYSLPQDVKESLEKGEISFDDISLVDLGQAEQDYQRRMPRPVVPEFVSPEPQQEDGPGLWDKTVAAGRAFGQEAIGGAAQTIGGTVATVGETLGLAFDPVGTMLEAIETGKPAIRSPMLSEEGRIFADSGRPDDARRIREQAGIPEDSLVASATRGGASAFPLLAGMATMNPTAGALVMGGSVFGPEFIQGTDEMGLSKTDAAKRAATQTLIEMLTERVGMGALMKGGLDNILTKGLRDTLEKNYGTKVAGAIVANMAEELTAAEAQMAADEIGGYKTYTPEEKARARQDAVVAGGLMGGAVRAVTAPFDPAVEDAKVTATRLSEQADKQVSDLLGQQKAARDKEFSDAFDERITREQMIADDAAQAERAPRTPDEDTGAVTKSLRDLVRDTATPSLRGFDENNIQDVEERINELQSMVNPTTDQINEQASLLAKLRELRADPNQQTLDFDAQTRRDAEVEALRAEEEARKRKEIDAAYALRDAQQKEGASEERLLKAVDDAEESGDQIAIAKAYKGLDDFYRNEKIIADDKAQRARTNAGRNQWTAQSQDLQNKIDSIAPFAENPVQGTLDVTAPDTTPPKQPRGTARLRKAVGAESQQEADIAAQRLAARLGEAPEVSATPVTPQPTAAPQQPVQEPQARTRPLTQDELDQGEEVALTPEERDVIAQEVETAAADVGTDQVAAERERSVNRVAALRQSLEENESTRGLVNLPRVSIVSRQDRANVPQGVDLDNDYGGYDRDTGQLYLNADKIAEDIESGVLPEGYGVAVALHEIAHPFDASGKRTGKRSVDNLLGDKRDALRQRVTDLANGGNRVAKTALELAGDNDFEVLTYFIEEAKKSRLEGKGMGRRAVNLLNDIISSIKGFITDNLGIDFKVTESDILRAADLMAKDFVKTRGAVPKDKGGVLKSFAGVKAKNAPLADYARAEELEIAGASPRQIWSETGWRRGVDDKWRFEIDDSRAKFTPEWNSLRVADQSVRSQKPLGNILDHDGILKNYPQLQKLPILKEKMKSTSKGYFMPGVDGQPGYIAVNPNLSEKEALSVILHEAQHAIQMVENFAGGGTAESVWRNMSSEEKSTSKEHAKRFLEERRASNKEKLDGIRKKDPATLSKVEKKSLEVLQKNILKDTNDLRSLAKGDEAVLKSALKEGNFLHDAYMRIAGEAEARNTQKRQSLTEGERREVFPTETQDVPDAELTIGGKPARGEQQRSEILKSRARPAQPSAEKLARDKATPATSNTTEVKPTTTAVAGLAPGALGKRGKDLKTPRKIDKTKASEVVEKTFDVIKNQVSQIAGKDRELVEMLLLSKGKLVDQIVAATNAMNRLRNAVDVSSRNIGKGARAKRKSVITGLRLSEIETLLDKANNGKTLDEITAGREGLKNKFPEVFDAWNYSRLEIDKLSIQLMREIMKKERLTNRDAQLIRRMKEQLGVYLTRQYVSNLQDKDVKRNFFNSVLGDWTAMAGMTKEQIAALPEDKKVGFDAKNYIRDFVLDIGNFDEVDSSSDRGSILRFERLYQSWIPGAESLPTDATEAQKDAYFERAKNEMLALKNSMSKDEYLADLEAKAETATKDLIEAYRDGKKNDMVEYFSNLASEGGVLKKRLKVPPPIRRLMGEIVNPILQMHQTQVAITKEIGRLVFINNIYETQKGEMWVDGVDRKGEAGEVFSRQLTGDKWGRLQGKWVRPDVFETLDIIESIGGNVDSYIQAMNQGRNDLAAGMVVDGALRGVHQASSYTKLSLIVLNPFNALMNYISNFQASLVNGNIPIFTPVTKESREAFKFAHNAAASLIGASNRLGVSPEAREAIRMYLTDSAIMGEYQADDLKKMEEAFISDFASREDAQKFLFGSMAQMGTSFRGRVRAAKNFVTDAYAMLDVIGKLYNYKMEEFFLTKLERAKKKENPKYKMMTPEQIKEKARGVIDDTNIGYHRAPPIAKQIEHISFGFLMNYISETGRITANLFQVAEQTRKEANSYPKGSEVRSMLKKRAALRYIGAAMNIFWNQATIELSKYALPLMVAGAMLDGEDDDDEAKKIERLELMMQTAVEAMDPSFRSKAWTAPYIADKKLFLFDGSRTGITEPTTQIAVDAMTGVAKYLMDNEDTEDLDRAAAMAKNLFGAGPLVGMFLKGGKPPLAKQNPQLYREIADAFGGEDTSAARYVSLAVGLLPASATNVAQLVKEDSTLSGASPAMKTAAVFGARFRVLNPRYDIPSSTFELKREVESARKSLREALVGETMSDEEFRDKYLEASEKKVDATKRVLANVSLAKQLGFDEEDIENMLTGTGYGDKRGAGISKKEATVLLRGEPVSVVMQPKDLDSTRDKMIQEVEVKLKEKKITPSQANTMIAEIESKYDRLSAILDEVNDTLVGPN